MANRLLSGSLGRFSPDDRDDTGMKRVDVAGILMAKLFNQLFIKMIENIKATLTKEFSTKQLKSHDLQTLMSRVIKSMIIEQCIRTALTTGNWATQKSGGGATAPQIQGVAQVLGRKTYLEAVSYLRRLVTPMNKEVKLIESRRLHCSAYGVICPSETPEGQSVGVTKNLALTAEITNKTNSFPVYEALRSENIIILDDVELNQIGNMYKIFVNGDWFGCTMEADELVNSLRQKRRQGILNPETQITNDVVTSEINIATDSGRLTRPLFIVDEGNKLRYTHEIAKLVQEGKLGWSDLIRDNEYTPAVIEYVDVEEMEHNCLIATFPSDLTEEANKLYRYSHCEIHPSMILGVSASANSIFGP